MANYAILTDGTDSFVLKRTDGSGAVSGGTYNGYSQQMATQQPGQDYDEITEAWECVLLQTSDADRALELQKLGRMRTKLHHKRRNGQHNYWCWIDAQTPTEVNKRYAAVTDIFIPQLDTRHWHPAANPRFPVQITREGAWRTAAPNTPWALPAATTLQNRWDGTGVNYLHIDPLPGDADSLIRLTLQPLSDAHGFTVGARYGKPGTLANFNPHFNAASVVAPTGDLISDSLSPGGQRITKTASSGTYDLRWSINWQNYEGDYLAFVVARPSANIRVQLRDLFGTGIAMSSNALMTSDVTDPDSGPLPYSIIPLGKVRLPPKVDFLYPHLGTGSWSWFGLRFTFSASATLNFRNMYLVPIDRGYVGSTVILGEIMTHIDTDYQAAYMQPISGETPNPNQSIFAQEVVGQYFNLPPAVPIRLYFYFGKKSSSANLSEYMESDLEYKVRLQTINRYQTLRG